MKKNSKKLRTLVALAIVAVVAVGFVTNVGIGTMSAPGIWDISILCPLGADNVPVVDVDACNGCGACELACISLSAGSITAGATDRAIVVRPTEEVEA